MNTNITEITNSIKEAVLKHVPAKSIYLFGSHAYGTSKEDSDIDIYVVIPDDVSNNGHLCAKIIGDLGRQKIFFIDLLLSNESIFNVRKEKNILERTIYQKGKILYEY